MGQLAYQYVRVSGRAQMDQSGRDRQKKRIADFARKNKIQIVMTYEEQASGTIESRRELVQMIRDLKQNPDIQTVLIEKLDRLARDLLVSEKIVHDLKQLNVNLISVAEGSELLNGDHTRTFIRQMFGAVAEFEKAMLVEKLRLSREQARSKRGKCEGRASVEELDPELLKLIRRLRRKRPNKKPRSCSKIAQELNQRGFRSVTGREFSGKLVQYLLSRDRKKKLVRRTTSPKMTKS